MDYKQTYEQWLNSPALSEAEKAELTAIAGALLDAFSRRLHALGVGLKVTDEALTLLAQAGLDPDYGARPLRRVIRAQVEDPAAELLLSGALPEGSLLTLAAQGGKVILLPAAAALPSGR